MNNNEYYYIILRGKLNNKYCDENVKADEYESKLLTLNQRKRGVSYNLWCVKITLITMLLAGFFSFVSEITSSVTSIVATIFLLLFLIVLSIIFDGIAMAVTSSSKQSFSSFVKDKSQLYYKIGIKLIENQERVANICADVIGDIFSIVSGSCSVSIVIELLKTLPSNYEQLLTILISSIVAGITVGGKAFMKKVAIKSANSYLVLTAKIISVFIGRKNVFRKNKQS